MSAQHIRMLFHAIANSIDDVAIQHYESNDTFNVIGCSPLAFALMHGRSAVIEHILGKFASEDEKMCALGRDIRMAILGVAGKQHDAVITEYATKHSTWAAALKVGGGVSSLRRDMQPMEPTPQAMCLFDQWEHHLHLTKVKSLPEEALLPLMELSSHEAYRQYRVEANLMLMHTFNDNINIMLGMGNKYWSFQHASSCVKQDVRMVSMFLKNDTFSLKDKLTYLGTIDHWLGRVFTKKASADDYQKLVQLSGRGDCLRGMPIHYILTVTLQLSFNQLPDSVKEALVTELCRAECDGVHKWYEGKWLYNIYARREHKMCMCEWTCSLVQLIIVQPREKATEDILKHIGNTKVLHRLQGVKPQVEDDPPKAKEADKEPCPKRLKIPVPLPVRFCELCDKGDSAEALDVIKRMSGEECDEALSSVNATKVSLDMLKALSLKANPSIFFKYSSIPAYALLDDDHLLECLNRLNVTKANVNLLSSTIWCKLGNNSPFLRIALHCGPRDLEQLLSNINHILGKTPSAAQVARIVKALEVAILRLKQMASHLPVEFSKISHAVHAATTAIMSIYDPSASYGKLMGSA